MLCRMPKGLPGEWQCVPCFLDSFWVEGAEPSVHARKCVRVLVRPSMKGVYSVLWWPSFLPGCDNAMKACVVGFRGYPFCTGAANMVRGLLRVCGTCHMSAVLHMTVHSTVQGEPISW